MIHRIANLIPRHDLDADAFGRVEALAFGQVAGDKRVDVFVAETGRGVEIDERLDRSALVARFLLKLADGGFDRFFVGFHRTCRQFDQFLARRTTKMVQNRDPVLVQNRENNDGTGVNNNLADHGSTVGFLVFPAFNGDYFALEQGFSHDRFFNPSSVPTLSWHARAVAVVIIGVHFAPANTVLFLFVRVREHTIPRWRGNASRFSDNPMHKQRVVILGSTGSIGQNTLVVLDGLRDRFDVVGLAAGTRWEMLAKQSRKWSCEAVALSDASSSDDLKGAVSSDLQVLTGSDAMVELIDRIECDVVIVAVVGAAGLPATMRAAGLGKRIGIANKESLVVAGPLLTQLAADSGATLIPIDSEHSAIFQAMHAGRREDVRRVVLTASGGPFRTWPADKIASATLKEALNHPTWDMGPKITIDSATMMNKALEIVEARWLFGLDHDEIDVIVHPESIIHSMVEFRDGSVMAQLGTPDMKTPIQYALTYPERLACPSERLDFQTLGRMSFEPPDVERFPALRLGYSVAERGGTAGAVFNAANESAVRLFRDEAIGFCDIVSTVERVLDRHSFVATPTFAELMDADAWARDEVLRCTTC